MDIPADLLAQFVGLTNASETLATQLLRDSGLNLEAAISSFFAIQEAGGLPAAAQPNAPSDTAAENGDSHDERVQADAHLARSLAEPDEPVRAPIPPMVDTLLPSSHIPRFTGHPPPPDPFTADGTPHGDSLAQLFRRPTHLDFSGSFEHAMTAGQRRKKWLLVNIQKSDVFACHVMNRDVWADPDIENLVQEHFVFWQRDETTPDGARYKQFYQFALAPHVALIDPRSGERLRAWGGDGDPIDAKLLRNALRDFVATHSLESDAVIRSEAPSTRPGASSSARRTDEDEDDVRMTEDAALAAAIAASMETSAGSDEASDAAASAPVPTANGIGNNDNRNGDREASRLLSATDPTLNRNRSLRAQQDDEFEESLAMDRAKELSERAEAERLEREAKEAAHKAKTAAETREMKRRRVPEAPGLDCTDPVTELLIRLPTGQRLQRRFRSSDTIGNVYDYVEGEAEQFADGSFELTQAYPRKSFTDRKMSLAELAPKAALVVHLLE